MKNFLNKIYAFRFLDDLVLIYPLYVVMFTDFGMQPWQVATLLAVWSTTTFLFEVPSGVWADIYSRKNILFFGQLVRSFGYLSWLLFPNFWGFLIGFVLWGFKSALTSGTFEALVYDELKHFNQENQYTKILGRTKTLSFIAILIASALASPAVLLGYPFVLVISSLAVLVSGFIIISIPKARISQSTHEKEYFSLLREGLVGVFRNVVVLRIVIFLSLAFALGGALDEYWTIFADGVGLPHYGLGLFLGLMSGVQGIGSFVAHRFEHFSNSFFYGLFAISGLLLILASYLFTVPALTLLIMFSLMFTIIHTVYSGRLQHAISSHARSTITSVNGFLVEIGVIAVYFGFGMFAQASSYRHSFTFFGIIVATIGLLYLLSDRSNSPKG